MRTRRVFMKEVVLGTGALAAGVAPAQDDLAPAPEPIGPPATGESIPAYLRRQHGGVDPQRYAQILGAANPFKEGDGIVGVAAADERSRGHARQLLAHTRLADIDRYAPYQDTQYAYIEADRPATDSDAPVTVGALREFLLKASETDIKRLMPGLSSDVIGCVVKLMTNEELIAVGSNIFNPLPWKP